MRKKRYIEYDYESAYEQTAKNMSESQIEKLLNQGKVKSCYATKTIKSGKMLEVELYPEFTRKANLPKVQKRSTESQRNLNDKNARKQLMRLIHANFDKGDQWITLTWDNDHLPTTIDEALRDVRNYINRLRYRRKKLSLPDIKYIYILELGETTERSHVHFVMDGAMSMDDNESIWHGGGRNTLRRLVTDDNTLIGLSNYLSKDPLGKRRWKSSLNLKKPVVHKNHQDFTRKHIRKMAVNQNSIKEIMERKYPSYHVESFNVLHNEINGGIYIEVRMFHQKVGRYNE